MYALAAGLAFVLVTLGLVNVVAGQVVTGVAIIVVGCCVAASTRLRR